jgi:AcrR family transcriptional regulator
MNETSSPKSDVRMRLVHAAAEQFAAKGLAGTSVRDITEQAETNLAAVNYYFAGKEQLYVETLRQMFLDMEPMRVSARRYLEYARAGDRDSAKEALRSFIYMFVESVSATRPHFDLVLREMIEPTGALEHMFREFISPLAAVLAQLVTMVNPAVAADPERLRSYCASIVAQCLHVRQEKNMSRAQNLPPMTAEEVQRRARHIADFCLNALD